MKLNKLFIKNIASIEEAVIEFDSSPLAESEVFLISGKTGSGKTTILDAVCLALYATTPRMAAANRRETPEEEVNANDPRQLLRQNSAEGETRLLFTGNDGREYEATWSVARAHGKLSGKLQKKRWSLKDMEEDFTIVKDIDIQTKIKEVAGLDFLQFTRTTLLAQGAFSKFLDSKDDEKAEILGKIINRDDFENIGRLLFQKTTEKIQTLKMQKLKTEGIKIFSTEQRVEKEHERIRLDKEYNEVLGKIKKYQNLIERKKYLDNLLNEIKNLTKKLEDLEEESKSDDIISLKNSVKAWRETEIPRNIIKEARQVKLEINGLQSIIDSMAETWKKLKGAGKFQQTNIECIRTEANKLDEKFEKSGISRETLQDHLNDTNSILLYLTELRTAVKLFIDDNSKLEKAKLERSELEKEIQISENELKQNNEEFKKCESELETAKKIYNAQINTINKFAIESRRHLHIGDECPVCLRKITAAFPSEEFISNIALEAEKQYNKVAEKKENLLNIINKLESKIQTRRQRYATLENDIESGLKDIISQERILKGKTAAYGFESINSESPVFLDSLISDKKKESEKLKNLVLTAKKLTALESELMTKRLILDSINEIVEEVVKIKPEWSSLPSTHEDKEISLAVFSNFRQKLTEAYVKLNFNNEKLDKLEKDLKNWIDKNKEYDINLIKKLAELSSQEIDVSESRLKDLDEKILKTKVLLNESLQKKEDLMKINGDMEINLKIEEAEDELSRLDETLKKLSESKGIISKELLDDEENNKKIRELTEVIREAEKELELWDKLNSLIGDSTGKKFRRIALSYVLSSLIESANRYLQTLAPRYILNNIPGTFSITVEDAWQGYLSRSASTLSGGETFLVSLALALALSDIGERLTVNILFIDEGFGTLSGEPLSNAVETLRSLHRRSGRHVGVISHIEELRERIPVTIMVEQDPNSSASQISVSGPVL